MPSSTGSSRPLRTPSLRATTIAPTRDTSSSTTGSGSQCRTRLLRSKCPTSKSNPNGGALSRSRVWWISPGSCHNGSVERCKAVLRLPAVFSMSSFSPKSSASEANRSSERHRWSRALVRDCSGPVGCPPASSVSVSAQPGCRL
ncbi:hypothetical protein D3C72_596770 [compost metagenome]